MKNFLHWYKEVFHGQGFRAYKSGKAKEKFADSILKIADKLFWAPLASLVAIGLNGKELVFEVFFITAVLLILGMWLRHVGLKAIDEVEADKKKKISAKRFRRSPRI